MEYILYVLMLVGLHVNGNVYALKPIPYATEARCEYKRDLLLNSVKPVTVVSYDITCVKIVLFRKSI